MSIDIANLGIDSILVFEVVARLRSLKLAANELALSQPAVTHALNKLEDKLEVQLCIRSRTHFALTEPGKRLFQVAKNIKGQLNQYQNFLKDDEEFDGLFSLSVVDNFENAIFSSALEKVVQRFPKIKINLQVQSAQEIQNSVLKGESDIGFGIFNDKIDSLAYRKLGEEILCYYISEKHCLWGEQIRKEDLVDQNIMWVDTVYRTKSNLETQVFIDNPRKKMKTSAYTNNLNCALKVLKTGKFVVPLPEGYLESKNVDFQYKKIKSIKTMTLPQNIVFNPLTVYSSKAANFFLKSIEQST